MRVRCTGSHVEMVLKGAGLAVNRPLFDAKRSVAFLSKEVAVSRVVTDLLTRGLRVYAPLNDGPATGRRIDLMATGPKSQDVLRVVVASGVVDESGLLQRTSPRRAEGVVTAIVLEDGVVYEPGL